MPTLLLTHFSPSAQDKLSSVLGDAGLSCVAASPDHALTEASFDHANAIIAHPSAGFSRLLATAGDRPVIYVSDTGSIREAVSAIRAGAADYLTWEEIANELPDVLQRVLGRQRPSELIGSSTPMAELRDQLGKVANTEVPVVVWGESGTGKELVASILHGQSNRSNGPLLSYNCAAALESSIDSDLFGSEDSPGLIRRARQGSLFLDEVAALPAFAQARLVDMLDTNAGQTRIIAGARRDLREALDEQSLREDLYFRLSVVTLSVPPLRDRGGDLLELAHASLASVCARLRKGPLSFSQSALADMQQYHWPGNVRELENAIERAVILASGEEIDTELLAIRINATPSADTKLEVSPVDSDRGTLEDYFVAFVNEHQDSMTETEIAKSLGISRKSLWERRQRLKIPRKKGRQAAKSNTAKDT